MARGNPRITSISLANSHLFLYRVAVLALRMKWICLCTIGRAPMTAPLDKIDNPAHFVSEFLSERQQQILQRICEGETIHDIARDLYISENTVKYHIKTLFKMLHAKNRALLVRVALERGLVK